MDEFADEVRAVSSLEGDFLVVDDDGSHGLGARGSGFGIRDSGFGPESSDSNTL
jgi:hypothetical protein